jgi:putative serine protease PepD
MLPSSWMVKLPKHLWTGDWRIDTEASREAAEEAAARHREALRRAAAEREAAAAETDAPRSRRGLLVASALLAVAAIAAAFTVGLLLNDGHGNNGPAPIPAVASTPVKPQAGQSVASAVYAKASPAVVSIRTGQGSGTGFLISDTGKLVTNAHVVSGNSRVVVRFGSHGTSLDGAVIGTDQSSDLAVVSIDPGAVPEGVQPLQFADSRAVQVGDTAIAIGNPFGLDRTATQGIVSGLGRHIQAPSGFSIDSVIQTDAPINPGNSGGPLLDTGARVIGVNSQIETGGANGNVGIGFAVPSNTVRQVVPRLEQGEAVPHPYLGISTAAGTSPSATGAPVEQVNPGGPADKGGVQTGDVIIRVGSTQVTSPDDVSAAIAAHKPGDVVDVVVQRAGGTVVLHVKLGTQPKTP